MATGRTYAGIDMSALDEPQGTSQQLVGNADAEPTQEAGPLLTETDPRKLFVAVDKKVKVQEPLAKNRWEAQKHFGRMRRGVPFSKLVKSADRAIWKADLPWGTTDTAQPIPNKVDDLCNKLVAQLMVDLPKPDPKPADDKETSRAAADLAKRFLEADGAESGTNDTMVFRFALDAALTQRSMFVWLAVDPTAGGWRPMQIMAHPQAVDVNNPLVGPMGEPTDEYVLRHVSEAGQFVESPAEAAKEWMPKHRARVLTPAQVRCHPATADVQTADGVTLLLWAPLSEAKRLLPAVAEMSPAQVTALCQWRPANAKRLLPPALRQHAVATDDPKATSDDTLVFWYAYFGRICPDYPDGVELHVSGANGGTLLDRTTLRDDVQTQDGQTVPILREIPVAQCRLVVDSEDFDPFGRELVERLGGSSASHASLYGSLIEHLDITLHPIPFVPSTSPIQDWQLMERTGKPVHVFSEQDKPTWEDVKPLPSFVPDVITLLGQEMDNAFGLRETAQGGESPLAVSGKAKEIAVAQAKVALEQVRQNFLAFCTRYWRIKLQLAQAKLTVPQQVKYAGEDAAYKQRYFTGADFMGVADVSVVPGTGTMMGPVEKQNYAAIAMQQGFLSPDEAREQARGSLADDLGIDKSPHERRIESELAAWTQGPPDGWTPAQPAPVDPMTGQPMMDPATGQPMQGQPASWSPFDPRPNDEEPEVAKVRHRAMSNLMSTSDYTKQPPEWRAVLDAEYTRMAYAAGIQTMRQQAEAAQQQAAQQQAQAQQQAAEERTAEGEAKDADHARSMEKEQMRQRGAQDVAAMRQASQQPPQMAA